MNFSPESLSLYNVSFLDDFGFFYVKFGLLHPWYCFFSLASVSTSDFLVKPYIWHSHYMFVNLVIYSVLKTMYLFEPFVQNIHYTPPVKSWLVYYYPDYQSCYSLNWDTEKLLL